MTPRTIAALALAGSSLACASAQPVAWKDVRPPEALVETLPAGALVSSNGVEIGTSPLSLQVTDEAATYQIQASAPGFEPAEVRVPGSRLAGTQVALVLRPVEFGSQRLLELGEPVGLVQAAAALLRADRPREALAFAQASLEAGDSPQAHKVAGEAHRKLGNRTAAVQELSVYLTLAPDAPDRKAVEQAIAAARKDIPMGQPKAGQD
jgi:hypothetical protein